MTLVLILILSSTFLLLFPLIWIGVVFLIGQLSGWSRLARYYRDERTRTDGEKLNFHSAYIGVARYKNCVTYEVFDDGLRISTWRIFQIGHPTLFIPWSEFHAVAAQGRGFYGADIGRPTISRVTLQVNLEAYTRSGALEPPRLRPVDGNT